MSTTYYVTVHGDDAPSNSQTIFDAVTNSGVTVERVERMWGGREVTEATLDDEMVLHDCPNCGGHTDDF